VVLIVALGSQSLTCYYLESQEVVVGFSGSKPVPRILTGTRRWYLLSCADGGSLVAGSSELKLFDLSSQKRIRKYTGHPVRFFPVANMSCTGKDMHARYRGANNNHHQL